MCREISIRKWRVANRDRERITSAAWRDMNREKLKAQGRARYHRDPSKKIRDREWKRKNRAAMTALQQKREAAKMRRTPKWANHAKIKWLYWCANFMAKQTGIPHHVDHIIPLQGETVCGLHVENNLRVITATENMSKHNKLVELDSTGAP